MYIYIIAHRRSFVGWNHLCTLRYSRCQGDYIFIYLVIHVYLYMRVYVDIYIIAHRRPLVGWNHLCTLRYSRCQGEL